MQTEDYFPEKNLNNMPLSLPINIMNIIIQKAKENLCKIYCANGGSGTGFFCNIPYGWNVMKVLMTNNHVLNKNDISIGKKVKFSLNEEKKYYEIEIDESRKVYTSKTYDITIIELKKKDNIEKNSFFDIDNRIFNENPNEIFKKMQVYLLHYPKGKKWNIQGERLK